MSLVHVFGARARRLIAVALLSRFSLPREAMRWAFRRHTRKMALVAPGGSLTFGQLHQRVMRVAGAFSGEGLVPGDVVLCQLPDDVTLIEWRLAALEYGVVLMTLHAHADSEQVWKAITSVAPRVVFAGENSPLARLALPEGVRRITTGSTYEQWIERALPLRRSTPLTPDSVAALSMTSGTTGAPKVLSVSHRSLMTSLKLLVRHLDVASATQEIGVTMSGIPLTGAGGGALLPNLLAGACLVVPRSYEQADLLDAIQTNGVERLFVAPSQVSDILDLRPEDLKPFQSLRQIIYGTDIMHLPSLIEALRVFGPILQQGYGSAEVLPPVTLLTPGAHRLAMVREDWHALHSVGAAVPEVKITIRDDMGRLLPVGRVGRVWVSSPTRFADYWEPIPAGHQNMHAEPAAGLAMGDMGYLDTMGRLHIMGREADMIRVDEDTVLYPRELEEHMLGHGAIKEVVVARGTRSSGPTLLIAASIRQAQRGRLPEAVLSAQLRDHLQSLKGLPPWPVEVRLMDRLPRSPLGKLLRREVRQAPASPLTAADASL